MTSHADILFPSQPSLSELLSTLKRSALSIHNRLASIRADADFVARAASSLSGEGEQDQNEARHITEPAETGVAEPGTRRTRRSGGRPLVANERCGSWYVPPAHKAASAYFKSTDGHERAWKFSTRRLNLHLVEMIETHDGVIIVDSTRRGKRKSTGSLCRRRRRRARTANAAAGMPDAFAATIPIWCAVLNLVLLPSHPLSGRLFLPPHLAPSTHDQIKALIPSFVASLRALDLTLPTGLTKPLRPLWITQDSVLRFDGEADGKATEPDGPHDLPAAPAPAAAPVLFDDCRPVICLTASRRVLGATEVDAGGYIQGAADDTENWAHGLTADLFWTHVETLLAAAEADLPPLIGRLVSDQASARLRAPLATPRHRLTSRISVCALPLTAEATATPGSVGTSTCHVSLTDAPTPRDTWLKGPSSLEVGLGRGKTASRNLRLALPDVCAFVASFLAKTPGTSLEPSQLVVACDSGRDLSVGTSLAIACYLFDGEGRFRVPGADVSFSKSLVKARLGSIMTAFPDGNPSRQTLQSVNSFLMDWKREGTAT
ncbi:hypothetical protein RJ55_05463 [Drechmeria coniospora]|nr:hypothetical protein RJ55_05463 [Drechmeria coniospora]